MNIKKFNKENRIKLGGHLVALQNMFAMYAERSVRTLLLMKLPEIMKTNKNLQMDLFKEVGTALSLEIKNDEKLIEKLSYIFSTEGKGKTIDLDEESFQIFLKELDKWLTLERINEKINNINPHEKRIERIIEGTKMKYTSETGEKYEAVKVQ